MTANNVHKMPRRKPTKRDRNVSVEEELSDSKLASTVAEDVMEGRWCWVPGLGWYAWDGRRWQERDAAAVTEAVRLYLLDLFAREVAANPVLTEDYLPVLMARKIRPVVDLARGIVMVEPGRLDARPDLLNAQNGVVDLRTGELLPHDPELMMTRITQARYVPEARHEDWDAALTALPDDVRGWYQVRMGQAITGYMTPDDVLLVAQGGGENGKSTLHSTMQYTLGGYSTVVPHRVLLANPGDHPTELMELRGARMAVMEELPESRHMSVQRLKMVIGTPRITARHIRANSVTWDATHTMVISTNYRPLVEETDHGTWRRLALVTFPFTYRKEGEALRGPNDRRGDPDLRDRVKNGETGQHEAALAWLVEGARRWYAAGRVMPAMPVRVTADTRAWRAKSDLVMAYFDDHLVADPAGHLLSADLSSHFTEWLQANGHPVWSSRTFAARFGDHDLVHGAGITKKFMRRRDGLSRPADTVVSPAGDQYRAWVGVRWKTSEECSAEAVDIDTEQSITPVFQDHVSAVSGSFGNQPSRIHEPSSGVPDTADTRAGGATGPDARPAPGGVLPDASRSPVVGVGGWYCPGCQGMVPANAWGECAGQRGRCGQRVHRYGEHAHGTLCRDCKPAE